MFSENIALYLSLAVIAVCDPGHLNKGMRSFRPAGYEKQSVHIALTVLSHRDDKLTMSTAYIKDTLDEIDFREDVYSTPIILHQELHFYHRDKLLGSRQVPILYAMRKTLLRKNLRAAQTPIYRLCVLSSATGAVFFGVNGSDNCNGVACPEFNGIYSVKGNAIFEGITTVKQQRSLADAIAKYKIDIEHPLQCATLNLWRNR